MKTRSSRARATRGAGELPRNEASLRAAFLREVDRVPGGERLHRCIQCGTCSGSCPVSYAMDHSPREMLALFRAGAIETLLRSRSIWLCASCYQCTVRCPAGIQITDLLYALKRTAMEKGILPKRYPVYVLSEIFTSMVRRYGRNHEAALLVRYYLRTRPGRLLAGIGEGFALWRHGRLPARARRIQGIDGLRRIIARAETFDRPQEAGAALAAADDVGYRAIGMESPGEKGLEAA